MPIPAAIRAGLAPAALGKGVRVPAPVLTFPTRASRILRYRADAESNVTVTPAATFAPSAVNLGSNTITIAGLQFAAPNASYTASGGTRVRFTSSVILPAPLQPGVDYILSKVSGDDYRVFPIYDASMWATTPGALPEDSADFAQNYFQDRKAVLLTSQGSGTHSIISVTLVRDLIDLIGNGYVASVPAGAQSDWNRWVPRVTDAAGKKALKLELLVRNQVGNSYCHYGKVMQLSGNAALYNSYRSKIANKRAIVQTFVVNSMMTDTQGVAKIMPTTVSTSTGVFTGSNDAGAHGLTTLYPARLIASGGAIPDNFTAGVDYWVKSVSGTTFTLHDDLANATAGTNPRIPTTTGTAGYLVYQPSVPADIERQRDLFEGLWSGNDNGNVISAHAGPEQGVYGAYLQAIDFAVSTSTGDVGAAGRTVSTLIDRMGSLGYAKVWLWFPSGSTGPTCIDTGAPLTTGYYWITKKPASSNLFRLHRSEASAAAGVGLAGSATTCIKYSAQGTGKCRIEPGDGKATFVVGYADTQNYLSTWRMPLNEKGILSIKIDYNPDDSAFVKIYIYWNGLLVDTGVTTTAKGNTAASANAGTSGFTLFNSFGIHVPWEGLVYEIIMEASNDNIAEADILADHAYLKQDYAIAA